MNEYSPRLRYTLDSGKVKLNPTKMMIMRICAASTWRFLFDSHVGCQNLRLAEGIMAFEW